MAHGRDGNDSWPRGRPYGTSEGCLAQTFASGRGVHASLSRRRFSVWIVRILGALASSPVRGFPGERDRRQECVCSGGWGRVAPSARLRRGSDRSLRRPCRGRPRRSLPTGSASSPGEAELPCSGRQGRPSDGRFRVLVRASFRETGNPLSGTAWPGSLAVAVGAGPKSGFQHAQALRIECFRLLPGHREHPADLPEFQSEVDPEREAGPRFERKAGVTFPGIAILAGRDSAA